MEMVIRGDPGLAVPCLQKRQEKIRFKREIGSGRVRGRIPEHPPKWSLPDWVFTGLHRRRTSGN